MVFSVITVLFLLIAIVSSILQNAEIEKMKHSEKEMKKILAFKDSQIENLRIQNSHLADALRDIRNNQ